MSLKITELEKDVIFNGFGHNEYEDTGEAVWTWSIQPNCKIVTEKQISGVISSLNKKGLAVSYDDGEDSAVYLTGQGKKILNKGVN